MSKFKTDLNNSNLSISENDEFKNKNPESINNYKENQNKYIKEDNMSLNSNEQLSELNISTENNENEKDEYLKNFIDLSFIDNVSNEPLENIINNNNTYDVNCNLRNLKTKNENCRINIMNDIKYMQLYKMMMLNNIYYQKIAYMNNFIHNYNIANNIQNVSKKDITTVSPNIPNKSHPSNKSKKFIDKRYLINLFDIKTNKEQRTTIRMMNIPSYFRPLDLARKLDEKFGISPQKENRVYDFIYIPFKESKKSEKLINAGYAFINFVHPKHIIKFYSFFQGKHLKLKTSGKICIITFASRQGINIKHNNFGQSDNGKYMFFSDTKNHFQLLTD